MMNQPQSLEITYGREFVALKGDSPVLPVPSEDVGRCHVIRVFLLNHMQNLTPTLLRDDPAVGIRPNLHSSNRM